MVVGIQRVVVDTSVVSIIFNRDRDWRAPFYEGHLAGRQAIVSFQTLEEIVFWPLVNGWGEKRRNELMQHMVQYEVIWPDIALVNVSSQLRIERMRAGRSLKTADAWIAATAVYLNCPLAADDGDFDGIPGLNVLQAPRP